MQNFWIRFYNAAKSATPSALHTAWWMVRITVAVSFAIFLLKYSGILIWLSTAIAPVFQLFGLPGDAAFAFISGYFINVYACVAVVSTIDISIRAVTIIGAMTLAAHAIPIESAIQKKTGSSLTMVIVVRTISSFVLGILLNLILPNRPDFASATTVELSQLPFFKIQGEFIPLFLDWLKMISMLMGKMVTIILSLNILHGVLREFGILKYISNAARPLMNIFGLSKGNSFLWIIANIVGLSYGASIMVEEAQKSNLTKRDIDLLNAHIGVSHSNIEDLSIVVTVGAVWWIVLFSRWIMSLIIVWIFSSYYFFKEKESYRKVSNY